MRTLKWSILSSTKTGKAAVTPNTKEELIKILEEEFFKNLKYSDIAIIYPFNKKKLKNGKTIYFQYMIKKELEKNEIPYIYGDDELTNIINKNGVTISNMYSIKNLEYKAIVFCELEMLYNHTIHNLEQDYQVNDFVGDLNKVYMVINRATDYLSIITSFNEDSSQIIKLLVDSKE